jgi:hypothetical protein
MNKFVQPRPYANPEAAARELLELANAVEPVQDGRIHIELINGPMLFEKATPAEYKAGLKLCIERGWLAPHESGHLREVHRGGRRPVRITIGTAFLSSRYLHGLWRGLICPPVPAPSTSAGPSPSARLTVGLSGGTS